MPVAVRGQAAAARRVRVVRWMVQRSGQPELRVQANRLPRGYHPALGLGRPGIARPATIRRVRRRALVDLTECLAVAMRAAMVSNERVRPPFAAALLTLGLVTSCDALYGTPAKGSSPVAGASGTGAMAGNAGRGQAGAGSGGGLAGVGGSAAVGGAGGTSGIAGMAVGSGGSAAGGPGGVGNGAEGGGSGAGGMGGGAAGRGGTLGSGGVAGGGLGGSGGFARGGATGTGGVAGGGLGGSGGFARGGATGTGGAGGTVGGTGGVTGSAGSNAAFSGGPCVTSTDSISVETFARGVDQRIHRRVFSNARWGAWADIQGLDATSIDARSDLDCAAVSDAVHLVASGTKPVGAILHAFGFGTSYNPFLRELPSAA